MQEARFILTPYYEIMDLIIPLTKLHVVEEKTKDISNRIMGRHIVEFSIRYDHSLLLCESKRQKITSFDLRTLIRFCKVDEMRCNDQGIKAKDTFPLHLEINLNNNIIPLPNFLPNDRTDKDGRRFPRPVDLTKWLIDNPIVINRLLLNWAQDGDKHEEYYFGMYLVRLRSCEELTGILLKKQMSAVSTTLSLVYDQCINLNGTVDEDLMLINTSINISLNCPVSRVRMIIPIRGQSCNHLQCFDCMTYLIMNFNKPTWQCPVCDKKAFYCYLEVDCLLYNIINDERSKSVENIQFNSSGQWRPHRKIPGQTDEDLAYYDINDFIKQSLTNKSTTSTSSLVLNESLTEHKAEIYLQQLLHKPDTKIVKQAQTFQYIPRQVLQVPIFRNTSSDIQLSTSNTNAPSISPNITNKKFNYNASSNSCQTSKVDGESVAVDQRLPHLSAPQYRYDYLPQSSSVLMQRSVPLMAANNKTSFLKITNVTSMARCPDSVEDIIVISDDEAGDEISMKNSINCSKKCQKRPTMVLSAPTSVRSSKQVKLIDNTYHMISRPNSAIVNSINSTSKLSSQKVKCTLGAICSVNNNCTTNPTNPISNVYPISYPSHLNLHGQSTFQPGTNPAVYSQFMQPKDSHDQKSTPRCHIMDLNSDYGMQFELPRNSLASAVPRPDVLERPYLHYDHRGYPSVQQTLPYNCNMYNNLPSNIVHDPFGNHLSTQSPLQNSSVRAMLQQQYNNHVNRQLTSQNGCHNSTSTSGLTSTTLPNDIFGTSTLRNTPFTYTSTQSKIDSHSSTHNNILSAGFLKQSGTPLNIQSHISGHIPKHHVLRNHITTTYFNQQMPNKIHKVSNMPSELMYSSSQYCPPVSVQNTQQSTLTVRSAPYQTATSLAQENLQKQWLQLINLESGSQGSSSNQLHPVMAPPINSYNSSYPGYLNML